MLSLKKKGKISKFTSNLFLLKKNEKYNFKKTQSVKIYLKNPIRKEPK